MKTNEPDSNEPRTIGLMESDFDPEAPAEATPAAWSVKPLEWRGDVAQSIVGLYLIEHSFSGFFWSLNGYRGALREGFDRREAAEAAAQADYQTKINPAIIVHPDPELAKVTAERDEAQEMIGRCILKLPSGQRGGEDGGLSLPEGIARLRARAEAAESLLASRTTAIEAAIEGITASVRAAKMAMFIHGRKEQPNDGWRAGIDTDIATSEAVLAHLRSLLAGNEKELVDHILRPNLLCLEWREQQGEWTAPNPFGEYSISFDPDEDIKDFPWCAWGVDSLGHFATVPQAKAAVQADHEQRVRSLIVGREIEGG